MTLRRRSYITRFMEQYSSTPVPSGGAPHERSQARAACRGLCAPWPMEHGSRGQPRLYTGAPQSAAIGLLAAPNISLKPGISTCPIVANWEISYRPVIHRIEGK